MPYLPSGGTDAAPGIAIRGGPGVSGSSSLPAFAQQANAGFLPQQMVIFLPEERPIPGATIFNTVGQFTTVAAQSGVAIPNAGLQIPLGSVGRIDSITLWVVNLLQTSQLSFSIRFNGGAIPGFNNLALFPGVVARATENFSVFIRVPQGVLIDAAFTNTDGGSYIVGVGISGWFWPESLGRLYQQQGQTI